MTKQSHHKVYLVAVFVAFDTVCSADEVYPVVMKFRCPNFLFISPRLLNLGFFICRFISYCVKEKGYTGFDFKDAEGEDDIVSRLATLKINMDSDS